MKINLVGRRINILGTDYVFNRNDEREEFKKKEALAIANCPNEEILLSPEYFNELNEKEQKTTIRHEIIHAFLYESGLDTSSMDTECWARNEEMVDWFAMQFPKILRVYNQLGVAEE